ncbi:hypothetical protein MCOR27_002742 [Pyricularia oryzae]|uniref:Carboxylic ester hydrolase n=1 Tax=Pyricularia grisea TaxID=148305 RepID=A0ABQ8NZZ4_PYRGI|nr:hypothetical protein MCOR01_007672 [Pyricularia oryzae]KAI6304535.1 hypothetical protein MCOR33_000391 [Pyricularia grisea]KAH9433681.1 hypothetical protein MCOR02_005726 [Pyricularia oryzae]KAI6262534.1 hypothetical protein MCOR19_001234 [Pyricularia oryzae]KAI6284613.1 hypothetical protein MCOR27_002742 [Pyricularia oryzae]
MATRAFLAAVCLALFTVSDAQEAHGCGATLPLTVDLGYALYRGVEDTSNGLKVWKGIQFAAPPTGKLRWQAPRVPETNRTAVRSAAEFGPVCPMQFPAPSPPYFALGNEDCLYLNVYAPSKTAGAANGKTRGPAAETAALPVYVFIHGGGYGLGDGRMPMEALMAANGNSFIAVTIQYRIGAFGFAASPEIKAKGVLNAGLLDQEFALKWVQRHIQKFGGDPRRVTIGGQSAGGGSVMLLAVARDGALREQLFTNLIPVSPYLPTQPRFDDKVIVERYKAFAKLAGCPVHGPASFDCLVAADTLTLQYASSNLTVGSLVPYLNWANIPVTDGEYLTAPASQLLLRKKLNGRRLLAGNNANEGYLFVPRDINTEDRLRAYIKRYFVNLSEKQVTAVLEAYPSVSGPDDPNSPRFETDGFGPATAVNVSQAGTGHQQRAYNIYAEATFVCPAYWLADAFSSGSGRESYRYQFSTPCATHGRDNAAVYGPDHPSHSPEFRLAFRRIFGNFILKGNPSIATSVASGASSSSPDAFNNAIKWPRWNVGYQPMLNLNQTGGAPYSAEVYGATVTEFTGPTLRNAFNLVDAYSWEGGRGKRCKFWQTLNPVIPQ